MLDFCIHPEQAPWRGWVFPVLHNRISSLLVLNTILVVFGIGHFPAQGLVRALPLNVLIHGVLLPYLDSQTSKALGENIRDLRSRGYSDPWILLYFYCNLAQSTVITYIFSSLIPAVNLYDNMLEFAYHALNPGVWAQICLTLAVSEVMFCLGHWLLHTQKWMMPLHVFHHSCFHASWSTNLLFHPLDLACEFAGPALSVLAMHFLLWKNDFTLVLTWTVFQLWYAYDHDESLRLPHCKHHEQLNSLYVIYSSFKGNPAGNKLRDHMLTKKRR